MKIQNLHISNFRGIRELDVDFTSPSSGPRSLTALIGDNGSGKTSALQSIALILSLATRRTRFPQDFAWHGFMADRVSSLGDTRVQLDILFDSQEVENTLSLFKLWEKSLTSDFRQAKQIVPPSNLTEVSLVYESGRLECPQGYAAQNQFLGRYYVKTLVKSQPHLRQQFNSLGDVFWFDQNRNIGSTMASRRDAPPNGNGATETWESGVEQLREFLVGWWAYHTSNSRGAGKDYIPQLETHFNRVFPDTVFRGVMPREIDGDSRASDFYFLMERDGRVFDIAEMSSGEQAIFPLLYEFVRLDIANSVVLIDELELHLHPPKQQALLTALPKIGPDCQFIVSTHSPYLEEVIPHEQEVRLEGGILCL